MSCVYFAQALPNSGWSTITDVRMLVRFDHKDFLWCPRHQGTSRQFECTRLITSAQEKSGAVLGPWQGFGVFCAGTAALLAVAGYLLKHRDA